MLTIQDIKKVTKAISVHGNVSTVITGVSINSRTTKKGNVFIAVKGARFDGHDFIRAAIRKGAVAVIVSKKIVYSNDITVLRVRNTTRALGQIAAWHRKQFNIPIIAVTGSTGKTTTKEMIASVLAKRFKVLKNTGTENNQYGVPLTLLKLNSSHQIAVLELGTNQPGDIRWLAQITRPNAAVFTNIGESHLERLKTQSGVFREKIQLIKHLDPSGLIIFNADDRYLKTVVKKRDKRKIIRFGCEKKADYQAEQITVMNNRQIQFKIKKRIFTIHSPVRHNVYNALAAISCGLAFKIRYNDIVAALNRFRFRGARQEIKKIGKLWLIDDTYNANPVSFQSAINTLDALEIDGKRIIVCADMLELGPRSRALHQYAGKMVKRSTAKIILTTGRHARYITRSISRDDGSINTAHCSNLKEMQRQLRKLCRPGDAILVKGSRGMHMERIVSFLKRHFK